ncbi:hypothetical protein ACWPKS_11130 [Coraliomargarita sp. W4R72]
MDFIFEDPENENEDQIEFDIPVEKTEKELAEDAKNDSFFAYNQESINNYKRLLSELLSEIEDPSYKAEVDLESQYDLKIRIRGNDWDGVVDETIARIILRYQEEFDKIYAELCDHTVTRENRIRIRAKLENGSSILDFLFDKLIKDGFSSMDDKTKKAVLICAILTIGGTTFGIKGLGLIKELKLKEIEAQAQAQAADIQNETIKDQAETFKEMAQQQLETFERIAMRVNETKAAPKYLIKQLKPEDTIQLPTDPAPVKKETATSRYTSPRKSNEEPARENIFDDFTVTAINFKNPKEPILSLECKGFKFPAEIEIVGEESAGIAEEVRNAIQSGQTLELPLNVHVFHRYEDVEAAKILGMGAATTGARPIEVVLKKKE